MLVRLSKNSFVRIVDDGDYAYIFNQLTFHDRCYIDAGVDILSLLSRDPQDQDELASKIINKYPEADPRQIYADTTDMLFSLAKAKFIVQGESEEELKKKTLVFLTR